MTWINQQGQLYEGDCQPGDRAATAAEVSAAQAAKAWAAYQQACASVLQEADKTISRIQQAILLGKTTAQAADVQAWVKWMADVRASAQGSQPTKTPTMPMQPPFPAGT